MDSIKVGLFVQDIEHIREKLGIDKIVLLGHSSGCYLAYLYALKYPEHIDAIIDCSAGPLNDKGFEETSNNSKNQLEQIDLKAIRALPGMSEAAKGMDDESLRIMANRFYDKTKVAEFIMNGNKVEMSEERGQEIRDRFYREMNNSLFNQKEYKKPKVKSLVIHAAEDPIPLSAAEQWADILDARLEVISKSNHFPFVEKPDEVVRIIYEFLKQ
ncbi:MAG: alpha/beta hydrolase [Paludibacter sp.]|nr:alpha/beta hydrolase [Paludibacter sp.]